MLHFNSFWKPNWSENLISDLCYKFANLKGEIGRVCSINVSNPTGNSYFIHFLWRYQSPVVDKRISATKSIKKTQQTEKEICRERGRERAVPSVDRMRRLARLATSWQLHSHTTRLVPAVGNVSSYTLPLPSSLAKLEMLPRCFVSLAELQLLSLLLLPAADIVCFGCKMKS